MGFLLGFSLPLLPLIGSGYLLMLSICISLVEIFLRRDWQWKATFYLPFLQLMVIWSFALLTLSLYIDEARYFILDFFDPVPPSYVNAIKITSITVMIWLLSCYFFAFKENRRKFLIGSVCGLLVSYVVSIGEIHNFLPKFSNTSLYWESINRFSGTLTDPNAFGIFLLYPFFLGLHGVFENRSFDFESRNGFSARLFWAILVVSTLYLGFLSGSRSFVLGSFIIFLLIVFNKSRPAFLALAGCFIVAVVGVNLLGGEIWAWLPEGLKRSINTVIIANVGDALYSRIAFWNIAFNVFKENWLIGIGLGRFPEIIHRYYGNYHLAGWYDNPNSLYLWILSELGIVGFLAFAVLVFGIAKGIRSMPYTVERSYISNFLITFLILFAFGPHIFFPEVAIIVAYVLGHIIIPDMNFKRVKIISGLFLIFMIVSIGNKTRMLDIGLYPVEYVGNQVAAWTRHAAQIKLNCDTQARAAILEYDVMHPHLEDEPLYVIFDANSSLKTRAISSVGRYRERFDCSYGQEVIKAVIRVSRVWTPAEVSPSGDYRMLGIRLVLSRQ